MVAFQMVRCPFSVVSSGNEPCGENRKKPDANCLGQQPGSLTAIFRPDEDGEWREKLRQAHEASEQARVGQGPISGAASWERRSREEEDESKSDEEPEVEDEEGTEIGEGESGKVWKAKRTLRKSVTSH